MNVTEFAQVISKHERKPYTMKDALDYLGLVDKTISEAVAMLREFDAYLETVIEAEMPDTSTPEGKLHFAKLTDPFT